MCGAGSWLARRGAPLWGTALAAASAVLLWAPDARASFDEFSDEQRPSHFEIKASEEMTLAFKGDLKLGLHDIEGKGGPKHDSGTDTQTLGTRSPHVELDSFSLALRLGLSKHLGVNTLLEFTTSRASLSSMWIDFRAEAPARLFHRVELGYQTPIAAADRRSERYALAAASAWKNPEFHLAYEGAFFFTPKVHLEAGVSLAMMRPLVFSSVQQSGLQKSGTINFLAYGSARSFSGNGPVGGARIRFEAWGAFAEAFGFLGRLAAESGTDSLRSGFPNYRALKGYSSEEASGGDFWWWGGRAGFQGSRLNAFAEAIAFREDLLDRWGAYAQVSYRFSLPFFDKWLKTAEPLVRLGTLRIRHSTDVRGDVALRSPAMINAVSWDWNTLDLALAVEVFQDFVWLRAEYYLLWEKNGVPELGIDSQPFRNNELLIQVSLRF